MPGIQLNNAAVPVEGLRHQRQAGPCILVLGLGSIGNYTAHTLADVPGSPSIKLLLHKPALYDDYVRREGRIRLETIEGSVLERGGFGYEVLRQGRYQSRRNAASTTTDDLDDPGSWETVQDPIEHLIVTTKTMHTVAALRPLRHRLTSTSTILFLQNGMGVVEEVNEKLFVDPQTRPHYILGIISHGVNLEGPFDVVHTAVGETSIGMVPSAYHQSTTKTQDPDQQSPDSSSDPTYLLRALPITPRLNATTYPYPELLQIQLEKLAVNAFCNPLCALQDASNTVLLTGDNPELKARLMDEFSRVACALPELRGVDGVLERFSVSGITRTVDTVFYRSLGVTPSMVWDLRARRPTEIEFISGYWVRRGQELGIVTPVNEELVRLVRWRQQIDVVKRIGAGAAAAGIVNGVSGTLKRTAQAPVEEVKSLNFLAAL